MSKRHILAIAKKEWLHITRDPMTIFLLATGPVLMLIIISYAMATDVKNIPTVIYDQDNSPQSQALVANLDAHSVLTVVGNVHSENEYNQKLEQRDAKLVVIIDQGFASQLTTLQGLANLETNGPNVDFVVDGTDPISAEAAIEAALTVSGDFVTDKLNQLLDSQAQQELNSQLIAMYRQLLAAPIKTEVTTLYNPHMKALWNLVPAMIAVALVLPGMSISTVIARERSEGTLEALIATPVDKHAILLGKALPYVATSLTNVVLMYAVARIVFGVPFRGNLILYLALSSLYVFATLAIGLIFSIMIKSMEAALWASMLFFLFPGVLLSGMFFPVEVFPFIIKLETLELPVVSGVIINRSMFLQGVGARALWWNILLLLIIAVEGFEIAARLFKKRIA